MFSRVTISAHSILCMSLSEIFNAEVLFRDDCTPDEFIDVINRNRVYLPCLYVYNKIDQVSLEEVDRLARQPHSVVVSCKSFLQGNIILLFSRYLDLCLMSVFFLGNMRLNLDYLVEQIWEHLKLIKVYTKKRGSKF